MTDYVKSTGSSGTMMIRDTGTVVEFWLKAGSSTFNHDLPWAYVINGVSSDWKEFDFQSGGDWQKLGAWTVTTDQTVTFKLGDTGTSGLGGPTTLSAAINRATIPQAPDPVTFSSHTGTSLMASFTFNGNGGAAIDSKQIGYGTSSGSPQHIVSSDGSTSITGLANGTKYYFWARVHNSEGWSPWSSVRSVTTYRVPDAPDPVILTSIRQTKIDANFFDNGNGGTAIIERQIGYGLSSSAPTSFISGNDVTITGLSPGKKYYFWSRVRNSVGWSPWSAVKSATLIAGAVVMVGTEAKRAVPYVKVAGVWTLAEGYVRSTGVWKQSQ